MVDGPGGSGVSVEDICGYELAFSIMMPNSSGR